MKLYTFPGQGSSINPLNLGRWVSNYKKFQNNPLLPFIKSNLNNPGSIVACSYLLWDSQQIGDESKVFLGHSLGELSALNSNTPLVSVDDLFEIANFRHRLMEKATSDNNKYGMWAVLSPKSNDIRQELVLHGSLLLANDNSKTQCVITGLISDLSLLKLPDRAKIIELVNPHGIPFHNNAVLNSIQGPLYDFIWEKMKKNNTHSLNSLNHPLISNINGEITEKVHEALENFVKSSTNIVEFRKCCETVNRLEIDEALHIGPSSSTGKLVSKNCTFRNSEYID